MPHYSTPQILVECILVPDARRQTWCNLEILFTKRCNVNSKVLKNVLMKIAVKISVHSRKDKCIQYSVTHASSSFEKWQ